MKKTTRSLLSVTLFALGFSAGAPLFAQGRPVNGTAAVTLGKLPAVAIGKSLAVPLLVDLTDVTGTALSGLQTPAVLGGYQIEISFDTSVVRFEGVSGGSSTGFTAAPVFTSVAAANASGKVRIVAAQTSATSPMGLVQVATLMFTPQRAGLPAINVNPISLSTAFQGSGAGPSAIPASAMARVRGARAR